jgi:hypothetical protein
MACRQIGVKVDIDKTKYMNIYETKINKKES